MSDGNATTIADATSIQRTIEALAARNVEAVLVGSGEEALAKLKELVPEGAEGLRQHLGNSQHHRLHGVHAR